MEDVSLNTLGTNSCPASSGDLQILQTIFGSPQCAPVTGIAAMPGLWAFLMIIVIIILLVPVWYIFHRRGPRGAIIYLVFVIIVIWLLLWWIGRSSLRQWSQPHCQLSM